MALADEKKRNKIKKHTHRDGQKLGNRHIQQHALRGPGSNGETTYLQFLPNNITNTINQT